LENVKAKLTKLDKQLRVPFEKKMVTCNAKCYSSLHRLDNTMAVYFRHLPSGWFVVNTFPVEALVIITNSA